MTATRSIILALCTLLIVALGPTAAIASPGGSAATDFHADAWPEAEVGVGTQDASGCTGSGFRTCIYLYGSGTTLTNWSTRLYTPNTGYRCVYAAYEYTYPGGTARLYAQSETVCGGVWSFYSQLGSSSTWPDGTRLCNYWIVDDFGATAKACKFIEA
jgi:hypothetical protein